MAGAWQEKSSKCAWSSGDGGMHKLGGQVKGQSPHQNDANDVTPCVSRAHESITKGLGLCSRCRTDVPWCADAKSSPGPARL